MLIIFKLSSLANCIYLTISLGPFFNLGWLLFNASATLGWLHSQTLYIFISKYIIDIQIVSQWRLRVLV